MKAKKLTDIDVEEISLVDVPAIRTKFVIIKREVNKMDELIKMLKEATGAELSEKQISAVKTLSEEESKELSDSLTVAKGYKEELPEELNNTLLSLVKFAVREQPEVKAPEITEAQKAEIIAEFDKSGKKLSKDTLDVIGSAVGKLGGLTEIVESLKNLLPQDEKEKNQKADDEDKSNKDLEKSIGEKVDKVLKDAKAIMDEKLAEKDDKISDLEKRLKTVEEVKGTKKSLEEGDDDDGTKVEKGKVKWPSFVTEEE